MLLNEFVKKKDLIKKKNESKLKNLNSSTISKFLKLFVLRGWGMLLRLGLFEIDWSTCLFVFGTFYNNFDFAVWQQSVLVTFFL